MSRWECQPHSEFHRYYINSSREEPREWLMPYHRTDAPLLGNATIQLPHPGRLRESPILPLKNYNSLPILYPMLFQRQMLPSQQPNIIYTSSMVQQAPFSLTSNPSSPHIRHGFQRATTQDNCVSDSRQNLILSSNEGVSNSIPKSVVENALPRTDHLKPGSQPNSNSRLVPYVVSSSTPRWSISSSTSHQHSIINQVQSTTAVAKQQPMINRHQRISPRPAMTYVAHSTCPQTLNAFLDQSQLATSGVPSSLRFQPLASSHVNDSPAELKCTPIQQIYALSHSNPNLMMSNTPQTSTPIRHPRIHAFLITRNGTTKVDTLTSEATIKPDVGPPTKTDISSPADTPYRSSFRMNEEKKKRRRDRESSKPSQPTRGAIESSPKALVQSTSIESRDPGKKQPQGTHMRTKNKSCDPGKKQQQRTHERTMNNQSRTVTGSNALMLSLQSTFYRPPFPKKNAANCRNIKCSYPLTKSLPESSSIEECLEATEPSPVEPFDSCEPRPYRCQRSTSQLFPYSHKTETNNSRIVRSTSKIPVQIPLSSSSSRTTRSQKPKKGRESSHLESSNLSNRETSHSALPLTIPTSPTISFKEGRGFWIDERFASRLLHGLEVLNKHFAKIKRENNSTRKARSERNEESNARPRRKSPKPQTPQMHSQPRCKTARCMSITADLDFGLSAIDQLINNDSEIITLSDAVSCNISNTKPTISTVPNDESRSVFDKLTDRVCTLERGEIDPTAASPNSGRRNDLKSGFTAISQREISEMSKVSTNASPTTSIKENFKDNSDSEQELQCFVKTPRLGTHDVSQKKHVPETDLAPVSGHPADFTSNREVHKSSESSNSNFRNSNMIVSSNSLLSGLEYGRELCPRKQSGTHHESLIQHKQEMNDLPIISSSHDFQPRPQWMTFDQIRLFNERQLSLTQNGHIETILQDRLHEPMTIQTIETDEGLPLSQKEQANKEVGNNHQASSEQAVNSPHNAEESNSNEPETVLSSSISPGICNLHTHTLIIETVSDCDGKMTPIGLREVEVMKVHEDPEVVVMPNFLTSEECQLLIGEAEGKWAKSKTSKGLASAAQDSYSNGESLNRTSSSFRCSKGSSPLIDRIEHRIAAASHCNVEFIEPLIIVRYQPGEYFNEHHDGFFRPLTVLIYLNDVSEGGETEFVELGFKVTPQIGTAMMWHNTLPNGEADYRLKHSGLAPQKEIKYVVNCFINKEIQTEKDETCPIWREPVEASSTIGNPSIVWYPNNNVPSEPLRHTPKLREQPIQAFDINRLSIESPFGMMRDEAFTRNGDQNKINENRNFYQSQNYRALQENIPCHTSLHSNCQMIEFPLRIQSEPFTNSVAPFIHSNQYNANYARRKSELDFAKFERLMQLHRLVRNRNRKPLNQDTKPNELITHSVQQLLEVVQEEDEGIDQNKFFR